MISETLSQPDESLWISFNSTFQGVRFTTSSNLQTCWGVKSFPTSVTMKFLLPYHYPEFQYLSLVGSTGLARHRDSKELWGLEYKTASESSARLLKAFDWNPQLLCYTLALRVGLTEQIQGMMVETLKVSKTSCETMLKPVYVLSTELDEFVKWLSFQCQLILMHEKVKDFPKQRTGCTSYPMFGMPGFMCDFEAACSGPDWTVFKSLYKVGQGHLPFDLGEIEKLTAADAKPVEVTEEMLTEALKSGV
jgi:hypothetical protein